MTPGLGRALCLGDDFHFGLLPALVHQHASCLRAGTATVHGVSTDPGTGEVQEHEEYRPSLMDCRSLTKD